MEESLRQPRPVSRG